MASLREDLMELLEELPREEITKATVRKLSERDQMALATFCSDTARLWLKRPPSTDEISLFLYGFTIGHEWVKTRWSLW